MRTASFLPFLLFTAVQAADPVTPTWTGFRGPEGTGVWANAKPPTVWDGNTGQNVRWKVPLANWGLGQPVVVKNKVFVISEPGWKHDWPLLQCFDIATGKLAWEKELNTLDLLPDLPATEKTELKQAIADVFTYDREWYLARWEYSQKTPEGIASGAKHMKGLGFLLPDTQAPETFGAALKIAVDPAREKLRNKQSQALSKIGWVRDAWRHAGYASGLMSIGHAYPTPVTDGERLYIATGCSSFWCFDLEGKLIWGLATKTAAWECMNAKSPLLYKNLFISDVGSTLRFFDKNTGKIVFSAPVKAHSISGPMVIRVGDQDLLLPCPPEGVDAFAYRLPDGQQIPMKGWQNGGATMAVNTDSRDTVFFIGGGEHGNWEKKAGAKTPIPGVIPPPTAVKFALSGDTLNATVLWAGIEGGGFSKAHSGILYHNGKLHVNGYLLDANTGKIIAGKPGRNPGASAQGNHQQIANGLIYGLTRDGTDGKMEVYSLDGKSVATNKVPSAKVEGEKRAQIRAQDRVCGDADKGRVAWQWFSYSCPFMIHEDSIFIRSNDELWCIGQK